MREPTPLNARLTNRDEAMPEGGGLYPARRCINWLLRTA
jgi:hypothetical protein